MIYDVVIIGGGLVGLSVALHISQNKRDLRICLVETEKSIGMHQSSHNSGVIHSGIYYTPGSLRAKNCQKGYNLLLEFCRNHQVPFDICGKLIVATDESETQRLDNILKRGFKNGLTSLEKLSEGEARKIEPHVRCISAIRVPQTGIIDFGLVARKYKNLLLNQGVEVHVNSKVYHLEEKDDIVKISTKKRVIKSKFVITCAGLFADQMAKMTMPDVPYQIIPFRGEFYSIADHKKHLVNHLIYPVPNPDFPFLGVHFTRMIDGSREAGPNAVLAFRREGYTMADIQPGELWDTIRFSGFRKLARKYWKIGWQEIRRSYSKNQFLLALQKLIPEIQEQDIVRGRSGVRAMACDREGNLLDDFLFLEDEKVIHVLNAPSPAATASLAIGKQIFEKFTTKIS